MSNKSYKADDFECRRGNFVIRGKVYRREEVGRSLTPIIICHGFRGNQREALVEAVRLAQEGYAVFTFDFVGGASFGKSDGKLLDMTIFTEKDDLRAVMNYVREQDYVDYSKLIIGGCSQGGFVSGLVAADYPDEVKALLLFYPALCIPNDAREGKNLMFRFDPKNVPDVVTAHGLKLNGDYARLVMEMDAVDAVSEYPGPIFLTCGRKDPVVDYSYMERLVDVVKKKRGYQRLADTHMQFFPVQDAGHGFDRKQHLMVAERVVGFLYGCNEILTIQVNITGNRMERHGMYNTSYVSFDAVCENEFFVGQSLPGSMDVQRRKLSKKIEYKADYVMQGQDYLGENCKIHIVNLDTGTGWIPTVETDSAALDFLNRQQCITIAENSKSGLRIHILANCNITG